MADVATTTAPTFTGVVDRQFFLAPLGGPQAPQNYLDRFPDTLYNKAIDSHLVKLMYALLGPAGVGWLRANYLNARLILEDYGVELFDLDKFYGNPLGFGRILEEVYDQDPSGLLPRDQWEAIRAKDAKYRNRALDYVTGARAGNTPQGMHLVARSGLGHEVEIIENYRYLYDIHSDDVLGLPYYGKTVSTEEMIVLPRHEIPRSETQTITISGSPTGGTLALFFPVGPDATNSTSAINYNATRDVVQALLEGVPSIGKGNVRTSGGPFPDHPIGVLFTGQLANSDVPQLQAINSLTGGPATVAIVVSTESGGGSAETEIVSIAPRDMRYAISAINRIKPVTTILTFGSAPGLQTNQVWSQALSSSSYQEVVRYVSGKVGVTWPTRSTQDWIEAGVEHEARRSFNDLQHHYQGFHNVSAVYAYTESALGDPNYSNSLNVLATYKSEHIGPFLPMQQALYPVLQTVPAADFQFVADRALADYAEPLTVTSTQDDNDNVRSLVNGVYPTEYQQLAGVDDIRYKDEQYWSSKERGSGTEYLELDLGSVQAVNYLYFEATLKPFTITVSYDVRDTSPVREFRSVLPEVTMPYATGLSFNAQAANKWSLVENYFRAPDASIIYTRFIRIGFTRRADISSPFINNDGTTNPYSIEVRNLRVGRNVS